MTDTHDGNTPLPVSEGEQPARVPGLHPVTLSAEAARVLDAPAAAGRVVVFPRPAQLNGERWSASLPVTQRWAHAPAVPPPLGERPPVPAEVVPPPAVGEHPPALVEAMASPAAAIEATATALPAVVWEETPSAMPGVVVDVPAAPASRPALRPEAAQDHTQEAPGRALILAGQPAGGFRTLSEEEGQHIAWMRTWLDERLSQPGNELVGLAPEAQIRLAIEARNAILPALADPVPVAFLPLARAYLFGGGPLDEWLHYPGVTDVTVNGQIGTFIKLAGQWVRVGDGLPSADLARIVNLMTGKHLTVAEPCIEAQTRDGSRLSAIHGVLTRGQPVLALRLFPRRFTLDELVRDQQLLTEEAAAFCQDAITGKLGIAVAGGTGTGKTTLLNALLGVIPPQERLIIIEDGTPELACPLPNVVYLETRRGTLDSKAAGLDATITATDLLERALRLAPDRILVGECRGKEAYAWLQAVNTGHPGSMTTLHADFGALSALRRMQSMVLQAATGLPAEEIRWRIAEAIQLVLFTAHHKGQRYLRQIIQVVPSADAQHGFAHAVLFEARPEEGQPLRRLETLDGHLAERMRLWEVRPDAWVRVPQRDYR